MLRVQEFLDRATPAGECPIDYLIPCAEGMRRVRALTPDELRIVRTELELLRRIRRRMHRPAHTIDRGRLAHYSAPHRAELEEIVRCAAHFSIDELIQLFDREFPCVREEILMSVVNEEAEAIAQDAIEAGAIGAAPDAVAAPDEGVVTGERDDPAAAEGDAATAPVEPAGELGAEPTAEPVCEAPSCGDASNDTPLEPVADGEALVDLDELADSLVAAEAALGEVLDELPADPIAAATHAELAVARPGSGDAAPMEAEECFPVDGSEFERGKAGSASPAGDTPAAASEAASAGHSAGAENPAPSESTAAERDELASSFPGSGDDEEGPDPLSTSDPNGAQGDTASSVDPQAESTNDEEGSLDVEAEPVTADDQRASECTTRVYDAAWAEGAVREIDAGIRKLAALLGDDVRSQWRLASECVEEIARRRAGAEENSAEVRSLLVELRALRDEAKSASGELSKVLAEARAYRENARLAKARAETAAEIAEKLTDQMRSEQAAGLV